MKRPFTLLFPASGNLFVECWRLFVVNYLWLVLLVLLLSTVTYAGKVGEPELKGIYQMLLALLLCVYCITYCLYWYSFGLKLAPFCKDSKYRLRNGLLAGAGGVIGNALLVILIEVLGFTQTGVNSYNFNVLMIQLLLLLSVFFMPVICGLGALCAGETEREKAEGTFDRDYVSHKV